MIDVPEGYLLSWSSRYQEAKMRVAMSSTRDAAIVPFKTKSVRFWPKYEVPELKVMSPGMVIYKQALDRIIKLLA